MKRYPGAVTVCLVSVDGGPFVPVLRSTPSPKPDALKCVICDQTLPCVHGKADGRWR